VHPNQQTIETFYAAFARLDPAARENLSRFLRGDAA
jgi:hypothetical protein